MTSNFNQSILRISSGDLSQSLESIAQSNVWDVKSFPLTGDASDRKYFRVTFESSPPSKVEKSVILMQMKTPVAGQEPDFIRMVKFLRNLDLPAPELYYYDSSRGLLFLEDFGPVTFEDAVRKHPESIQKYYRQAVELLFTMHSRATNNIGPDCPAYHLRFDVEKLMWELDFMLEHFVGGLLKTSLGPDEIEPIRNQFKILCQTLANQKPYFTHRDFHSRNLMVKNGKLSILDFQDARMGPCQYDLVSLLKDSYVPLGNDMRNEMIEFFINLKEKDEKRVIDRKAFQRIFDWMSIQRNFKAIGTFAYQSVSLGNHRYLEYIPRTLSYICQTLDVRSDLSTLKSILSKQLPELWSQSNNNGY